MPAEVFEMMEFMFAATRGMEASAEGDMVPLKW